MGRIPEPFHGRVPFRVRRTHLAGLAAVGLTHCCSPALGWIGTRMDIRDHPNRPGSAFA